MNKIYFIIYQRDHWRGFVTTNAELAKNKLAENENYRMVETPLFPITFKITDALLGGPTGVLRLPIMNGEDGQLIRLDLKYQKTDLFACFVDAYKCEPDLGQFLQQETLGFVDAYKCEPSLKWVSAIPVKHLAHLEERGYESYDFERDIFGMCLRIRRAAI